MTAATIPDDRARADPRGACIADQRQELTNKQFADAVHAVAATFAGAGLAAARYWRSCCQTRWNW
jgi:tellurite resistance protein